MSKKPAKKAPAKKTAPKKAPAKKSLAWALPDPHSDIALAVRKEVDPYHSEYDGVYTMKTHDQEENALKRWFDNYKVERYASFANTYECLVVSEVPSTSKRGGSRYHCDIVDEGRGTSREVIMDHTAPEPPLIFFAAKMKYVPPPPKTAEELRREAEYRMMRDRGYRPVERRVPVVRRTKDFNPRNPFSGFIEDYEITIEWVREEPRPFYWHGPVSAGNYTPAPPPRHRRNV